MLASEVLMMVGVLDLFGSCIPSWYNDFHTRRLSSFRSYLFLVLVIHTVLRAYTFCYVYHLDFFEHFSPIRCVGEFNFAFPAQLTINLDSRTNKFYFENNEDLEIVFTDKFHNNLAGRHNSDVNKDKAKFIIRLPSCFSEAIGVATSYLSKSSMSADGIWRRISPTIVLDNGNANGKTKRYPHMAAINAFSNEKPNFLTIGQKQAYFLDLIPVTSLVTNAMKQMCSLRYSNNDYEKDVESICTIDKYIVATKLERVIQKIKHIFYGEEGTEKSPNSGKEEEGKKKGETKLAVMGKATDKGNIYTLIFIVMFSSLFSFTSLIDFIDLYVAALLISWLIQFGWVRSVFLFRPEWDDIIVTLPTSFYFGLAIHTSTPVLMANSLLPYPYADLYGFAAFVHLGFAFYVLCFNILPSMSRRNGNRDENNRNGNPDRVLGLDGETRRNMVATEMVMYYNFLAEQYRNAPHLSFQEKLEWKYYLKYQDKVYTILSSTNATISSKLQRVQMEMESVSTKIPMCARIVHVWSCLNDVNGLHAPARSEAETGVEGGPGFCYGVSSSGVYILLAWYDSPVSQVGTQVIARFPGSIIISEEICPAFTFQPTTTETAFLLQRIEELKDMLKTLPCPSSNQNQSYS